jgi:hypothetical protein
MLVGASNLPSNLGKSYRRPATYVRCPSCAAVALLITCSVARALYMQFTGMSAIVTSVYLVLDVILVWVGRGF